jgi:DNA mismatch repair protein MutL
MSKISILPDAVANQIAAGEVVERPSSIVKELVENSIDAGASRIVVEVENGGRGRISVTDNGEGMAPEDVGLAFQRHATSKLASAEDLESIPTLGFRGEALPSIASVARVRLETQRPGADLGAAIEIVGGDVRSVAEGAFPDGTRVIVEDVFFNVPARRKFLKSESWELSQITAHSTHYALSFPRIHFVLKSGRYEVLQTPPASSRRERIFQVFGADLLDELVEYEASGRQVGVHVFTSRPHVQKHNRRSMFFFVNGRAVREKALYHACSEAYRNILPSGTFPIAMLYVDLPPGDVDVNVHPAKTEVRFRKPGRIHDTVRDAIGEALRSDKTIVALTEAGTPEPSPRDSPAFGSRVPRSWDAGPLAMGDAGRARVDEVAYSGSRLLDLGGGEAESVVGSSSEGFSPPQASTGRRVPDFRLVERQIRALGQLRDSFIVAADETGLVLIDQHVAHERVLFERYECETAGQGLEIQRLLTPIVLELSPAQQAVFDDLSGELARNGFEVEPFGPRTVAVSTAPAMLRAGQVEALLLELVAGVERERRGLDMDTFRRKIAATVSCHAAIKVNNPLDIVRMNWLVGELMKTDCPTVCPHGRPIIVRYDLGEIEKAFRRSPS